MRYSEIMEANLKLVAGDIPRVRGSYGAFLITMHPLDFLKLTMAEGDRKRIEADKFPKDREVYADLMGSDKDFGRFNIPFLNVVWPTGKIRGHEGRHRAMMIHRQGGTKFPVVIYMRFPNHYELAYSRWDIDTEETTEHREQFDDYAAAERRRDELEANNEANRRSWDTGEHVEDQGLYRRMKINTLGGATVKGSPTRATDDIWERKAFVAEDMPKQLVGQYDDSVVITDYRVGLIKGYQHFR